MTLFPTQLSSTTISRKDSKNKGARATPRLLHLGPFYKHTHDAAAEHVSAVGCSPLPAPSSCSQLQQQNQSNNTRVNTYIDHRFRFRRWDLHFSERKLHWTERERTVRTGRGGRLTDEAGTSELLSTRSLLAVATNILRRRTWTALRHVMRRCEFE